MLSENIKNRLEKIRHQFPTTQALLLPALHLYQEENGWISPEGEKDIAEFLELPLSKVKEVITFYTMYLREPVGKAHIQVCTNLSCWLKGSEQLVQCVKKRLGIGLGETTSDGRFTLNEVECIAACGTAPAIQVNEDYFENLDAEKMNKLIDELDQQISQGKQVGVSTRGMNHV